MIATPGLSVLLLTYNHEKYIAQAIESALAQTTNFPVEILVGDDCSTDNTGNIVNDFAARYPEIITVVTSASNVGALKNEQRMVAKAKGKYLAFLEGDDFWTDPLKLQKQFDFLEDNPDYGLVHGDVNHFHEDTGKTEWHVNKTKGVKIPNGDVFEALLKPDPLFIKTATACFRKELVSYFDYDLAIREQWPLTDLPLWMDITYNSKTFYFDEVFATYRLLNESASRTVSPEKKYNYYKALYGIKKTYLDKYNCDERMRVPLEEDYYRNMIKIGFNLDDRALVKDAINFLKSKNLKVTRKESLMLLSTKNKLLKTAINFIK